MVAGVPRWLSFIAVKKGASGLLQRKQTSAKSSVPSIVSNIRMLRVPSPSARLDETNKLEWDKLFDTFTGLSSLASLSRRLEKDEMARLIEYSTAVASTTTERALVLTSRGLIGLGPQPMQRGDLLCLLRGGGYRLFSAPTTTARTAI
jgi:hypothetical protein